MEYLRSLRRNVEEGIRSYRAQDPPDLHRLLGYHCAMAWVKTIRPDESDAVRDAMMAQRSLYPKVYGSPMDPDRVPQPVLDDSITLSHSLIPAALQHAFATFGVLLNPELPLSRREHEMIATTVSVLNKCFY